MTLLLTIDQTAAALGVSRTFFEQHLQALLPEVDLTPPGAKKRTVRYAVADVEALTRTFRKERTP